MRSDSYERLFNELARKVDVVIASVNVLNFNKPNLFGALLFWHNGKTGDSIHEIEAGGKNLEQEIMSVYTGMAYANTLYILENRDNGVFSSCQGCDQSEKDVRAGAFLNQKSNIILSMWMPVPGNIREAAVLCIGHVTGFADPGVVCSVLEQSNNQFYGILHDTVAQELNSRGMSSFNYSNC
jgi:hypothetical protein